MPFDFENEPLTAVVRKIAQAVSELQDTAATLTAELDSLKAKLLDTTAPEPYTTA